MSSTTVTKSGDYNLETTTPNNIFQIYPWDGNQDNSDFAAYFNGDYALSEGYNLVGGVRYTDNETTGDNIDYRAGVVATPSERWTFKALYGTSYRSPNLTELFTRL